MVKRSFSSRKYYGRKKSWTEKLDEILKYNNNSTEKTVETTEVLLDAKDTFFFYPIYLQNKSQAQKLLKTYTTYQKNHANIIKEIMDMEQLLEHRILHTNRDAFLSDNPINKNYFSAFEDLVRRLSQYRNDTGKELFNNSEDIREYMNYLVETVKPSLKEYSMILKFTNNSRRSANE